MKIGDMSRAARTPVETIRYYEREGLLARAPRSDGNYRIYDASHVERLNFIRHCRALDMTLAEIRELLRLQQASGDDCGEVDALLDAHIEHVTARIRELRQLQRALKALREQCAAPRDVAHCAILNGLAQAPDDAHADAARRAAHVGGSHGRATPSGAAAAAARPARVGC